MKQLEHEFNRKTVQYTTSADYLSLDYIKSRKALFYISMKNRIFSKELISWVLLYSKYMNWQLEVCVVDKPYYAFVEWQKKEYGISDKDEIGLLNKVSFEIKRKTEKIISAMNAIKVNFLEWNYLHSQCPDWIKTELREGFNKNGRVFELLSEQTKDIVGKLVGYKNLPGKFEFILDEVPVLIWAYYNEQSSLVDIYPGENAIFFVDLEKGVLANELPLISRMIVKSKPLLYGNIKA